MTDAAAAAPVVTNARRSPARAGLVAAALLLAVAGLVAWDTTRLSLSSTYGLGPAAMPWIVVGGLVLLGLANLVLALKGEPLAAEAPDGRAIGLILGGLAVLIASIAVGAGFILGTAVLFAMTAAAFGRRAPLADLGIGLVLAFGIYLLFAKLLTLSLPVGPLERLL